MLFCGKINIDSCSSPFLKLSLVSMNKQNARCAHVTNFGWYLRFQTFATSQVKKEGSRYMWCLYFHPCSTYTKKNANFNFLSSSITIPWSWKTIITVVILIKIWFLHNLVPPRHDKASTWYPCSCIRIAPCAEVTTLIQLCMNIHLPCGPQCHLHPQ